MPHADADHLVELARMESAVVRADLEHPGLVEPAAIRRLRYLLGFARLDVFEPGAAERGGTGGRPDVDVGAEVDPLRIAALGALEAPLRVARDPRERLRGAQAAFERLHATLADTRRRVLDRHGSELSARELDAEAGRRTLVSVAGGGGGAGYVYIGAYRRLEEAGVVPSYVIGASIGALLGLFRARSRVAPWDEHLALAKGLDRATLLGAPRPRRRFGIPGVLALDLRGTIGRALIGPGGEALRLADLEIPYDSVVAGVRRRSYDRLPARFRRAPSIPVPNALRRLPTGAIGPAVAARMWQAAAFFDPRVVTPVVLGADGLTERLPAIDAAGFSAAIPGVLHYEPDPGDRDTAHLLSELLARDELAGLVDGGVVANVPAELAWQQVRAGRIGTRNAFLLAFDCFHPQWEPAHLWLQPITQAVSLQMTRNARFADWLLRFEPTLSPVNLVPGPAALDEAIGWGASAVERHLPMIERFLEPVGWEDWEDGVR